MAMSTGGNSGGPMSEINVTPLVDVMLVLLIIFMITAPLMTHLVTVKLPIANPHQPDDASTTPPLDLAVKEDGSMYLNDQAVNEQELISKFAVAAQQSPQPELQIRAEKDLQFKTIKQILNDAKAQGMVHVAFMTTGDNK